MDTSKKKPINKKPSKSSLNGKVRDFSNDPFFIKKGKDSETFLNKTGFPMELLEKK